MQELSAAGKRLVEDLSRRLDVSEEAIRILIQAIVDGSGRMAQFNHPDLGGMGQWSQGGMIMIGDMFNNGLKHRVGTLCNELAMHIRGEHDGSAQGSANIKNQSHTNSSGPLSNLQSQTCSLFVAGSGPETSEHWWPKQLGAASSCGAQNDLRYAYFPEIRRLAIQVNGRITVYDTGEHQFYGFSQQQSSDQTLTFKSQLGLVDVASLPAIQP